MYRKRGFNMLINQTTWEVKIQNKFLPEIIKGKDVQEVLNKILEIGYKVEDIVFIQYLAY